jgi:hypothetical protein
MKYGIPAPRLANPKSWLTGFAIRSGHKRPGQLLVRFAP